MEQSNENNNQRPNSARKVVFGLIIVVLGVLLLADNFEGLSGYIRSIVFSWPMLFIAIGVLNLFGRRSYVTGFIFIMIGIFFLIPKIFFNIDPDFTRMFWPLILIGIGVMIIVRRGVGHEHHHHIHKHFHDYAFTERPEGYIDEINIFGGSKTKVVSQNFKGGKITSIFGGSELDFTNAQLAEGTNVIDMVCLFGGASLILPADWKVRSEVVSILGGFADKRLKISNPTSNDRELIIKGVAIFGGGEIKSI